MANNGSLLKPGTIQLLLDGILEVRRKFGSVTEIASYYHLANCTVYRHFKKFSKDTGIPYSDLLYFPHNGRGFIKPRNQKQLLKRFRPKRGTKPPAKRKFFYSYDYSNFYLSMVAEYLRSPNPEHYVDGATLLEDTITKILEVCQ